MIREPGSVVADRYTLEVHLGTGRYGEIYRAVDRLLSDPSLLLEHRVALHLLHPRVAQHTRLLQKLESSYREPHLWSHANVVKVRGFGSERGQYFLVMELLDGESLRARLDDPASEQWSTAQSFAVLRAAGDALTYAHAKGAVHGELKPDSLFITTDREIKVLDLLPASSPRTEASFVEDAAPNSAANPDRRDDVFGLACIAYELLTGQRPYDGRSALEAANAGLALAPSPRLDARQWDAIARGLALRRADRTKTVAAFLTELGVANGEAPLAARSATPDAPVAAPADPLPRRAQDDDMPIIGDHSGNFDARPAREQFAEPPRPSPRKSDRGWRLDPQDVHRYAERTRSGERRGRFPLAAVATLVVAAGAIGAAVYWSEHAVELLALVRPGGAQPGAGGGAEAAPGDLEPTRTQPPTVAATPELPPEAADAPPPTAPAPAESELAEATLRESAPPSAVAAPATVPSPPATPATPAAPAAPAAPETFELAARTISVSEGAPGAAVNLRRRGGDLGESSVAWWTSDGTALAGDDYADLGTIIEKFAAGESTRTIHIPIVGDSMTEGVESFYVNLGEREQPDGRVEPTQQIEIVIQDDD